MQIPHSDRLRHALRLAWITGVSLVIIGSLLPGDSLPIRALARLDSSDKIQHFVAYAVLALLPVIHERPRVVGAIAFGHIGLGVLREFDQPLATRDFEIGDMVADAAGVCVGLATGPPLRRPRFAPSASCAIIACRDGESAYT